MAYQMAAYASGCKAGVSVAAGAAVASARRGGKMMFGMGVGGGIGRSSTHTFGKAYASSLSAAGASGVPAVGAITGSGLSTFARNNSPGFETDLLVIGCGMAGSAAALQAARQGMHVTMLTSAPEKADCNSFWAQGGIIYKAQDDSPELLASDVHTAGAGICNDAAVMKLAREGPRRVEELLLTGTAEVPFDRHEDGRLALCLEASHNRARIIHWRDATGKAITTSIQAAAALHPNITLRTATTAVDLALAHADSATTSGRGGAGGGASQCVGVHAMIQDPTSHDYHLETIHAPATLLATGGLGDLYAHTSNPASAKGAGFGMALRAGAALSCMEYVQFHPTTLHLPGERSFLLSEALRGEGARLVDRRGLAFAKKYHPGAELAPRDVVSRTIISEMRLQGADHMYLDISHRPADWLRDRFPSIHEHCLRHGLDMTRQPLPVVPAAHYFCGGVSTDLTGRTSIPGLFAAGEVACTGLHGANRLASTSLLEGLVWGCSVADHLADTNVPDSKDGLLASANLGAVLDANTPAWGAPAASANVVSSAWNDLRNTMWEDVGVVRRHSGLQEGARHLSDLADSSSHLFKTSALSPATVDLRNGSQTGAVIAAAALANPHSVGAHYVEADEDSEDEGQAQMHG